MTPKPFKMIAAALGLILWPAAGTTASAAEIRVISSNALKATLEELAPAFEQASGHKLVLAFGAAAPLKTEIEKGAMFDVALLNAAGIDDLIKQGRLAAATRADLARSGIGVAVRKGAPAPDIGTVEAFKRALLAARSVAYIEQGGSGIYLKALLPRLGIADALKDTLKLLPPENPIGLAITNGEVELGMTQISEILPYAGAQLVGPLPADIQSVTVFTIAAAANAPQPEPAKALIRFLATPAAAAVLKAKGLDPA
jgi:molybdate transport system substrate-binding protein